MCGYASARISAHLNIPPDSGTNGQDPFDTFEDISKMLQFGFLLGWFVGVFDQKRFAWLFNWYVGSHHPACAPVPPRIPTPAEMLTQTY